MRKTIRNIILFVFVLVAVTLLFTFSSETDIPYIYTNF